MVKCIYCNFENPDEYTYCIHCSKRLEFSNVDNFKYYVANKIYDKMDEMCIIDIMSDCESMSNDNVSYVIDNLGPEFSVRLLIYKNVGRE